MTRLPVKTFFLTGFVSLSFMMPFGISESHAGFEWIPPAETPQTQAPVQKPMPVPENLPAAPVSELNIDDMRTPHAASSPAPVRNTRVPREDKLLPLAPLPVEKKRIAPVVDEDGTSVIKVKRFTPSPSPANTRPQALTAPTTSAVEDPKAAPQTLPPLPVPAIAQTAPSVQKNTRLVMPDDAPLSARARMEEQIQNRSIKINPRAGQATKIMAPPPAPKMQDAAPGLALPKSEPAPAPIQAEHIEGFGSDIPLALALSQVVPAKYSYSFGTDVNVGQRVSWSGGKPWIDVVEDMVSVLGLQADIRGQVVHVYKPGEIARTGTAQAPQTPVKAQAPQRLSAPKRTTSVAAETQHPRRMNIKDPGMKAQAQPQQTLSALQKKIMAPATETAVTEPPKETKIISNADLKNVDLPRNVAAQAPMDLTRVSPPSKSAAALAPSKTGLWEARKGDSLKQTLDRWSRIANIDLEWNADYDYRLESDVLVTGDFQRAVTSIFKNALNPNQLPELTMLNSKLIIQDPRV